MLSKYCNQAMHGMCNGIFCTCDCHQVLPTRDAYMREAIADVLEGFIIEGLNTAQNQQKLFDAIKNYNVVLESLGLSLETTQQLDYRLTETLKRYLEKHDARLNRGHPG